MPGDQKGALFKASFSSVDTAQKAVQVLQDSGLHNAVTAWLVLLSVALELSQPLSAAWLAKTLGHGAWFQMENHPTVVSPRW